MNAPANIQPLMIREAVIQAPRIEAGKAPVAVILASTGADVVRTDWLTGEVYIERLDVSKTAVDLEYLASGQAHLLDSHELGSTEAVLGTVTRAWIEKGSLYVEVTGPLPGTSPRLDEVWGLVKQGILKNVSVGYSISETKETREAGRIVKTATRWTPREVSLVAIGADSAAQVVSTRASASTPMKEQKMNPETTTAPREQDVAERARASEIFDLARRAKLPDEVTAEAIKTGMSLDTFRARALDYMVIQQEKAPTITATSHGHNADSIDDPNVALRAAGTALLRRNLGLELKGNEQAFASIQPSSLARMYLEAKGERVGRFESAASLVQRGYHTTSDFPILLGNSAQTVLADLIAMYQGGITQIAPMMRVRDFRTVTEARTSSFPSLLEVPEAGSIKFGTITEGGESVAVKSFARALSISFQALTNDSLGGFDVALRDVATAAAELKSSILIAAMAATMRDGKAVFHADHNNLAGTGAGLTLTTLSNGRTAMRAQTALGSTTPLGIGPKFMVVPSALETDAQTFAAQINPASAADVNPFAGNLIPVVEPQLTGKAWYLAADPAMYPALKLAVLEGFDTPAVETENSFTELGSRFRVHWHIGAFVTDYRPLYKNPGLS